MSNTMPASSTLPPSACISQCPPDLAHRAQSNIQWFKEKHSRQVARLNSQEKRINMMTAENWLMRTDLVKTYKTFFEEGLATYHLSYADGLGGDVELLDAASQFFNRVFSARTSVQPDDLVLGAGCSSLLENILYDVCEPGEGVLIETPFWGGFDTSFVLRTKVQAVHVTVSPNALGDIASPAALISTYITAYERALHRSKCTIKAILVCNPHNPCGTVYPTEVLHALLQFAQQHNLFYISDEIYALSTINMNDEDKPRVRFSSALSVDLAALNVDSSRVCTLYSISKDLGSSGLRLGFVITRNPLLRLSLAISNHSRVSTFTSLVITSLFRDTSRLDTILEQNRAALCRTARLTMEFLTYHGIPFVTPDAGIYIWARLGYSSMTWEDEARLNDRLEDAKVSVGAGQGYYAAEPGWFRITFALPTTDLLEGLRRIEIALRVKRTCERLEMQIV